jgi:Reverse transcriptase (RNA-dependent DNA polymerase).
MRFGVVQVEIISPVLFSLYQRHAYTIPRRRVALFAHDTSIIATSQQPALLVTYLEPYLSDLEWWLREQRITISVSKSTAMLFAKTCRRFPKPRPFQLFGEPIHWVDTACYLGVTLDTQLTWSSVTD